MLKLNFNLRHQDIRLVNKGAVVATDSKNYLVAKFHTLSDDWETPLTAIFTDDKHKQPYAVIVGTNEELAGNECFVPWEVLTDECNVYVSVYCGNLHTTVTAAFKVRKSGYTDGETPPPPSPTVYDIILQAINDLRTNKQDKLTAGQNITITEENVISASSGSNDYAELENKPSINNVTLSGNKSSDDLSLQGKLTAGQNITIEDNVISAKGGGVTDYNELENIPVLISADSPTGYRTRTPLKGRLDIANFLYSTIDLERNEIWLRIKNNVVNFEMLSEVLQKNIFKNYGIPINIPYNFFTDSDAAPNATGVWYINRTNLKGMPVPADGYLFNFLTGSDTLQFYYTSPYSGYAHRIFFREQYIGGFRDWQELTGGGAQIVSGVVNANGTITFTDSEDNSFTTSGESVIGADGFSPSATVQQTASGATITVTDKNGTTTANISNGAPGQDYILTTQDKDDIADIVLAEFTGSIVNGELNTR